MKIKISIAICCICIFALVFSSCQDSDTKLGAEEIYEKVSPSVVTITADSPSAVNSGTGFFYKNGSTIVTNSVTNQTKNQGTILTGTIDSGGEQLIETKIVGGEISSTAISCADLNATNSFKCGSLYCTSDSNLIKGVGLYSPGHKVGSPPVIATPSSKPKRFFKNSSNSALS